MSILTVGVDIEETERFIKFNPDSSFVKMVFTPSEIKYCYRHKNYWIHLAARFTAKEAVLKAVRGFNIKDLSMKDIEVINDDVGKPGIKINKSILGKLDISLSVSHTEKVAISFVIIYK